MRTKARQAKVKKAKAAVKRAQRELEKAGARLLKAMLATTNEIEGAKEGLVDIHHDADADGWAGAEWNQMIAWQIESDRESDRLDRENGVDFDMGSPEEEGQ